MTHLVAAALTALAFTPLAPLAAESGPAVATPAGTVAAGLADEDEPTRVVFVCEHGAAKSVVAAAHFNRLARERGLRAEAVARGTDPVAALHAGAAAGLAADGLAPGEAVPRQLTAEDIAAADVVVALGLPAPLPGAGADESWTVPPIGEGYEASRQAMVERIERLVEALAAQQTAGEAGAAAPAPATPDSP